MAWFSRFTRFGDSHLVYGQEAANSCGIACVMMTVFKVNKLRPGAQALHQEQEIYDVYSDVTGATYDGSQYSFASKLADTLNRLSVGTWEALNIGGANVTGAMLESLGQDMVGQSLLAGPAAPLAYVLNQTKPISPVIVLVKWNTAGAHFVCVDTINKVPFGGLYASVCDPWDGDVHITEIKEGEAFNYVGRPNPLSWELWGEHNDYSPQSTGSPNGWIIRRTA